MLNAHRLKLAAETIRRPHRQALGRLLRGEDPAKLKHLVTGKVYLLLVGLAIESIVKAIWMKEQWRTIKASGQVLPNRIRSHDTEGPEKARRRVDTRSGISSRPSIRGRSASTART
jgi:hypothetical protein